MHPDIPIILRNIRTLSIVYNPIYRARWPGLSQLDIVLSGVCNVEELTLVDAIPEGDHGDGTEEDFTASLPDGAKVIESYGNNALYPNLHRVIIANNYHGVLQ